MFRYQWDVSYDTSIIKNLNHKHRALGDLSTSLHFAQDDMFGGFTLLGTMT